MQQQQPLRSEHGGGRWEWSTEVGWDSHRNEWLCGEQGSSFMGTGRKTEGLRAQPELPSQVLLQARAGKEPGTGLGSPRAVSTKEQSQPQGLPGRKGGNCSRSAVGTGWEALRGAYSLFLPFCIHLACVFYQKNNGHPVSKVLFSNIYAQVSGSEGPFSYYIFLKIDGDILSCLLIQTSNLNHSWFRSGQVLSFHIAYSFLGKKLPPLGSLHFLYSLLISQLSIFQFHYTRNFFATCVLSITMNPYVVFKTSILTSSLFQNVLLCRVQSSFKHTFCSYGPASCIAFIITLYIQPKSGQ